MPPPEQAGNHSPARPVRIVVCDDSAFMRRTMTLVLDEYADLAVVAAASTGNEAIEYCRKYRPDVLTLDLELPDIDGLEVLQAVRDLGVRVLVVSSSTSTSSTRRAVEALAGGALDVIGKPGEQLARSVFAARLLQMVRDIASGTGRHVRLARVRDGVHPTSAADGAPPLLVIGASTGGPAALDALLGALPSDFRAPVVVIQHMPEGFSAPFARRLQRSCALPVLEASDGDPIVAGRILVAAGGRHLHIARDRVYIRYGDRVRGMRPSIDVALRDAAATWAGRTTAVVLTGIGSDGLDGAHAVRAVGGRVLVQDRDTSAVWGMPRAVSEAGLADLEVSLDALPSVLTEEAWR
jgi:two-component system chemotaxis response regulator CheB